MRKKTTKELIEYCKQFGGIAPSFRSTADDVNYKISKTYFEKTYFRIIEDCKRKSLLGYYEAQIKIGGHETHYRKELFDKLEKECKFTITDCFHQRVLNSDIYTFNVRW